MYFFIFLTDVKFKKCVAVLLMMILFSLRYVPDQYRTQQICDKAVYDCLVTLKFVPDWVLSRKMIKIFFTALYADKNKF